MVENITHPRPLVQLGGGTRRGSVPSIVLAIVPGRSRMSFKAAQAAKSDAMNTLTRAPP